MTPAEYEKARQIFHQTVGLEPAERVKILDRACAENPTLRRRLEALLAKDAAAITVEEETPIGVAHGSLPWSPIPDQVGAYRILGVLGEGGMGTVYLAEQREPIRRRVALKVIKLGVDPEVLARFDVERQALALMNHPNIARVHDAGSTPDGRPYFAMEQVDGVSITEYCDRHRLSVPDRLTLFLQVCQGVEHAHHRGVIHRDLKPSNIIVCTPDDEPVAKIIDFGVARATNQRLTEKTLYTEVGRVIGTPAYMAPEQAELTAEGVDHRTDIYSLGVFLYELLVGQLPLEIDLRLVAFDEIVRRIREVDPPTPSTRWSQLNLEKTKELAERRQTSSVSLLHELRGDLDWICMKALEKERDRRYKTAIEFGDDVERYLKNEAVLARPPSGLYRLKKYVRKNRVPVIAVCAVVVSLSAGLAGSVWLAIQAGNAAEEERQAKENETAAKTELQETLGKLENALAQSQRQTYRAELQLALQSWSRDNLRGVRKILKRLIPADDNRRSLGFEWHYLWNLAHGSTRRLVAAPRPVKRFVFSTDGAVLYSGDQDGTIWRVPVDGSAAPERVAEGRRSVVALALAPDGTMLAVAEGDRRVKIVRMKSPNRSRELGQLETPPHSLAFSARGKWLAAAGAASREKRGELRLWNLEASKPRGHDLPGHTHGVVDVTFVPCRRELLASASWDGTLRLWDPKDRELVKEFRHNQPLWRVRASPDGELLFTSDHHGAFSAWSLQRGQEIWTRKRSSTPEGRSYSFDISPDATFAAVGGDESATIRLWKTPRGELHSVLRPNAGACCLGFSPDGRWLASTSGWDAEVELWDYRVAPPPDRFDHGSLVQTLEFTPDGETLAVGGAFDTGCLRDVATGRKVRLAGEESAWWSSYSPSGEFLATSCRYRGARVYRLAELQELERSTTGGLPDKTEIATVSLAPFAEFPQARAVTFAPDGRLTLALTTSEDPKRPTRIEIRADPFREADHGFNVGFPVASMAFSRDVSFLAAGGNEGSLRLWRVSDWRAIPLATQHDSEVRAVQFSPDRAWMATASHDASARIWSTQTGQVITTLTGHAGQIWSLAISPDGTRLATGGGEGDGSVRLWDTSTWAEIIEFRDHKRAVSALAWSPDGTILASGGYDGVVRLRRAR